MITRVHYSLASVPKTAFFVAAFLTLSIGTSTAIESQDPAGGMTKPLPHFSRSTTNLIEEIAYNDLNCLGIITFDDVPGGDAPGTNYDEVFESDGALFAERFVGQVLTYSGDFDVLTGVPTNPLTLQVGESSENLTIYFRPVTNSQALAGNGPVGYPDYGSIGEGSFAVIFDYDQSEFGFELGGGNGGPATVDFFRRDGSLIDSIEIPNLSLETYGFRRVGGVTDIAGISVQNTDPAGIVIDNICHTSQGVPGTPPVCLPGGPYSGDAGSPVQFDGSNSYDPDGSIVSYVWDFGDGNSGTGPTPTHVYTADGEYSVTLCVTDNDELTSCCVVEPVVPTEQLNWGSVKSVYR